MTAYITGSDIKEEIKVCNEALSSMEFLKEKQQASKPISAMKAAVKLLIISLKKAEISRKDFDDISDLIKKLQSKIVHLDSSEKSKFMIPIIMR